MDTVWLIAADAFFLFFSLRLCIDRCNERRLDVQTGKKERQSLFIFHTEIKLSDWLDKTFSGLFFFFFFTTHEERGEGCRGVNCAALTKKKTNLPGSKK